MVLKQQEVVSGETEERMKGKKKQRRRFTSFMTRETNARLMGRLSE